MPLLYVISSCDAFNCSLTYLSRNVPEISIWSWTASSALSQFDLFNACSKGCDSMFLNQPPECLKHEALQMWWTFHFLQHHPKVSSFSCWIYFKSNVDFSFIVLQILTLFSWLTLTTAQRAIKVLNTITQVSHSAPWS